VSWGDLASRFAGVLRLVLDVSFNPLFFVRDVLTYHLGQGVAAIAKRNSIAHMVKELKYFHFIKPATLVVRISRSRTVQV
jgi:hypothetical protein